MENTVTPPLIRYEELKAIEKEKEDKFLNLEKLTLVKKLFWGGLSSTEIHNPEEIHKELVSKINEKDDELVKVYEERNNFQSQSETSTEAYLSENAKKHTVLRWFYISSSIAIILLIALIASNW